MLMKYIYLYKVKNKEVLQLLLMKHIIFCLTRVNHLRFIVTFILTNCKSFLKEN